MRFCKRFASYLINVFDQWLMSHYTIEKRIFVRGYNSWKYTMDDEEWRERSRTVALDGAGALFGAADCVVLMRYKKSQIHTIDGVSLCRVLPSSRRSK